VREIVGFVMGAAAGAAGALFATSTEGRALIERLREEARPETERAATEWEPVLREVGRAVRLAARELETATADLRSRIGEIAAALPAEIGDDAGPQETRAMEALVDEPAAEATALAPAEADAAEPALGELPAVPIPSVEPDLDDPTPGA
jgi:gas vesicle protein